MKQTININNLVVLLFLLFGCGKTSIKNFDSIKWKNDMLGCKGIRYSMMDQLQEVQKSVVGLSRNEVLNIFGKPENTELHPKGQLLFRYNVAPSSRCENQPPVEDNYVWEIRLNALGIVSEANLQIYSK